MVEQPDPPSKGVRIALTVVFVAFVAGWGVVGVRGLINDDSRWAWGMFPYSLGVEVKEVRFVDVEGHTLQLWKLPARPRVPRSIRPGIKGETYGYGKGALDDLIRRELSAAARDAPRGATAVEATVRTQRSERPWVEETVRLALLSPP